VTGEVIHRSESGEAPTIDLCVTSFGARNAGTPTPVPLRGKLGGKTLRMFDMSEAAG
jgi:hypothetical protein